jgi:predicted RNA binding protein YcfA (HicA-like mRNA interferase family)
MADDFEKLRKARHNTTFAHIENILLDAGFVFVDSRGSHHNYRWSCPVCPFAVRITVPFRKPTVKPFYVELAIKCIKEVRNHGHDDPK